MKKSFLVALAAVAMGSLCGCGPQSKEFKVDFYVDSTVYSTITVKEGEKATKPTNPTKEGYTFTDWFKEDTLLTAYDFNTVVTADLNLYAGFEEVITKATVTFDLHGGAFEGTTPTTVEVDKGLTITKPTNPVKDGYEFVCWSTVADDKTKEFRFSTVIDGDTTLHAVWKEIVVEAKYNITASSQSGLSHQVKMAADDDIETYWAAADKTAQTLTVDLGEVKAVTKVSQEFVDAATWVFAVKGSFDGENYYELLSNADGANGSSFETVVSGYYRYVKLEIAADQANVATSKEFIVESNSIDEGTNVWLHYKGVADCWAGGYEPEMMFDGNESTYYCASDAGSGHYYGANSKSTDYYIDHVELRFPDAVAHHFKAEYSTNLGTTWNLLSDESENAEDKALYSYDVNGVINGCLVTYYGNNSDKWPAMSEMRGIGYKVANPTKTSIDGKDVYDLGCLSRVGVVELSNKDAANISIEISADGVHYTSVELNNGETNFVKVGFDARYVRYSDDASSSIRIFATSYLTNLVLGTSPAASDATEAGNAIGMATLNKECEAGFGRFYCRPFEAEGVVDIDFKNNCYVESIFVKTQDYKEEACYKLKIEVSKDGQTYTSLKDTYEEPVNGQEFSVEVKDTIRFVRISIIQLGGWTNINTIAVYGYGNAMC